MTPTADRCRNLVVLDNGLQRIGDHSFAIARALVATLAESGPPVRIFSFRLVDEGVRAHLACTPHFQWSLYATVPPSRRERLQRRLAAWRSGEPPEFGPSEAAAAHVLNASFRKDLARLPADVWAAGNVVLLPGLIQNQIVGLAEFLARNAGRIGAKIVCQLMFEPTWQLWATTSSLAPRLYAAAFDRLRPLIGETIVFTTENRLLGAKYERDFGVSTGLLPVPLKGARVSEPEPGVVRIGYFGYSKIEKGFHLLPEAVAICRAARPDLRFVIQAQHHDNEPVVTRAIETLRGMDGVRILDGALSEDAFAAASASVDIVVLPYHPELFGLRGSGIFIESVSAGRLVVATKATWAGRSIDAGEAIGETFDPYTSESLAAAILRLCASIAPRRAAALARAAAFAQANSIERYVEHIFEITGFPSPHNGSAG